MLIMINYYKLVEELIFIYPINVTKIVIVAVISDTLIKLQKVSYITLLKQSSISLEAIRSKLNRLKHSKLHIFLDDFINI
jgi:hypothetical protein